MTTTPTGSSPPGSPPGNSTGSSTANTPGRPPSRKEASHDRILDAAARALRRNGFSGVGVAGVMKEAGLTHGGFYAHFKSRDALLAAALERAGRDSATRINRHVAKSRASGVGTFRAFVEGYLADVHLKSTEAGCPVAALSSDMARCAAGASAGASAGVAADGGSGLRDAARQRVQKLITGVQNTLPAGAPAGAAAAVASTLVGALQLARTLGNNAQGRALLGASRQALLAQYDHNDQDGDHTASR